MLAKDCTNLEELWGYVNRLNQRHFPDNGLMPILGDGKRRNPRVMFVFINPTVRNISSDRGWSGPRFPFVGTRQVWRIFHRAGLFDERLINRINGKADWSVGFTNEVLRFLRRREFYLTNIVKWTGPDAALPESAKVRLFLPVLEREIELVRPKYVVTFGLIPFTGLTKQSIRLSDYYRESIKNRRLKSYKVRINNFDARIIPCYFPIGRGNPRRAVQLLRLMNSDTLQTY